MKKKSHTNVHFDYGGYYSEEHEWISRNSIYGISFKTAYLEEITYSVLVDKICMKIATLETSGKLKLSYSLSKSRRESYIVDDEDVYVFITSVDKEGLKPVLNVELLIDLENNQMVEQVSRAEVGSSFGVNYGDVVSDVRVDDVENERILSVDIFRDGETAEQQKEPIIEVEELMDNVVNGNDVNAGNEDSVNEDRENVSRNKIVAIERPMDNDVGDWLDCRDEYNELPRPVEERQLAIEWEDGTGLEIGQEFCTREALRDLVNRVANKNCFGFITIKSDPERNMLRCRQAPQGCRWYL